MARRLRGPRKRRTLLLIRITSTAICGSDLHLFNGIMPTMEDGDILGHEPMGEVVEVGSAVRKLKKGDRVVVPFTIACGACLFCKKGLFSLCDTSNPNAEIARKAMGQSPAGLFGFSHMLGGFPGGQAQYLRVPFADVGPVKIPDGMPDEKGKAETISFDDGSVYDRLMELPAASVRTAASTRWAPRRTWAAASTRSSIA